MIKQITKELKLPSLILNGEDLNTHELLSHRSVQNYKNLIGTHKLLVIDEAQNIPDVGNILKIIVDEFKGLKILISGSSAFDIFNKIGEPLTGRKITFNLYPFSEEEIGKYETPIENFDNLKMRLVYGNYPEVYGFKNNSDKIEYLKELVNSYLLKDILVVENVKNSDKILSLLKLISYQVGGEVSYHELGRQLGISKNTVERYLDLLSKVFILHKVSGFSRNLRKEVVKNSKWFFTDNGIRNTIIANFSTIENRNDVGALWENYIISERIKKQNNSGMIVNNYFWRTYDKQEIDWIEEREGKLFAYECKWKEKKIKIPGAWKKAYADSEFKIINAHNYHEWVY
ncbi:MAG: ATP-binding protein [Melioribacteraceae bacterium]|nr:ATP-binding protein [Melioribacteraceae bacterium]